MHSACVSDHATAAAVQDPVENTLSVPDTWERCQKKRGWNDPHMVKPSKINSWSPRLTVCSFFSPDISNVEDLKSLQTLQRDLTNLTIACKETHMRVEITKTKVDVNISWLHDSYKGHPILPTAPSDIYIYRWTPLIDLPLRLPIIKWFIPDVYLSPVLMTPELFILLPEDIVRNSNIMCKDKPLALGFII